MIESFATMAPDHTNEGDGLENDICFILTSAFLIFTMQTGYGLLESGTVSRKNEVNILLKNAINIVCGSLAFWSYGFAFSSRETDISSFKNQTVTSSTGNNPMDTTYHSTFFRSNILTPERMFIRVTNSEQIGTTYAEMAFQLAYATTCTAIISGAMAERCRFLSYFIFSFFSNILFCLPARWTMFNGWLSHYGAIDIGGSGTVHLVGGCAGLLAALLLGPRLGRFDADRKFRQVPMGNPTNAVHGIILLWWGWLGYSAGSSFGVAGDKWKYAARSSVATIMSSMAGGAFGMIWSALTLNGLQDIKIISYSILAGLVAISGGSPIITPIYSIITGVIGALLTMIAITLVERLNIDDPTDSFSVHAVAGAWGLVAIGLFSDSDSVIHYKHGYMVNITVSEKDVTELRESLLLCQLFAIAIFVIWSLIASAILLLPIYFTIGLRMSLQEEILGPDYVEHGLIHDGNRLLLDVVKHKIRLVYNVGLNEAQVSGPLNHHYAEQQRLRQLRKRSLTPSPVVPTEEVLPKFRTIYAEERMQNKHGRYYHYHERKRLPIRTILDSNREKSNATNFSGRFRVMATTTSGTSRQPRCLSSSASVWTTRESIPYRSNVRSNQRMFQTTMAPIID
ncbi:hypothetical protein RDWZM_003230 [Blomia tropicalis]|uniref:Ammonium transporter AmtB-like domain-containing protein n=1 Tax=Blomia tropicalis TaxID=40697 RepID=A0A9Q0MF04_BLOTA|nr:Ammonium Transporter Family [Blomia tropicalis]KAJ6224685.1 hypothetical protein RDWZM_003230 [Blomia tropicalis]